MFSLIKRLLDIKWKEFKQKNKIWTYKIDKTSCFDDKRYVLYDRIHTLAYFHKDCNKKCDKNENDDDDDDDDNNNNNNNDGDDDDDNENETK